MKYIENQMKIIELVFNSRGISKEDRENLGIDELLKMNVELNKDDFDFNENKTSDIDLVKLMENNFNEKKRIFDSKQQFMVYIGDLKSQH